MSRLRLALFGTVLLAQPNPYRTVENWFKLPEGRTWGSTSTVAVDSKGHIWIAERCGANSCAGKTVDPNGRPDGPGSTRDRGIRQAVDGLAVPTARDADRRIFRDQIAAIADSLPDLTIPAAIQDQVLRLLSPDAAPVDNMWEYAATVPRMLQLAYLALQYITSSR